MNLLILCEEKDRGALWGVFQEKVEPCPGLMIGTSFNSAIERMMNREVDFLLCAEDQSFDLSDGDGCLYKPLLGARGDLHFLSEIGLFPRTLADGRAHRITEKAGWYLALTAALLGVEHIVVVSVSRHLEELEFEEFQLFKATGQQYFVPLGPIDWLRIYQSYVNQFPLLLEKSRKEGR